MYPEVPDKGIENQGIGLRGVNNLIPPPHHYPLQISHLQSSESTPNAMPYLNCHRLVAVC